MNADLLLAHYEKIADAPDAIARLRRFILDLAVRGKLVPQDANDEPAAQLLTRISREKARLVKTGEISRESPLPALSGGDHAFILPKGWEWVRLGTLCELVTSGSRDWAKHYATEGAIFVRMGNLSKGHYRLRLDQIQRVKPPADGEGTRTRLEGGDILVSITGDVGLLGLIPDDFGDAYINQHTALVRPLPEMKGRYLAELFRSPFAQNQFNAPQRGIKNSFRLTDVTRFVVPLPPLVEQHRIIAKVDELMGLCDRLEAARAGREAVRDRLAAASLARLNAPDPETFQSDARFALDALPALTTRPDQIKALRQTILNLAVRGKLVPQDTNDEQTSCLLTRMARQREELVTRRKIRDANPPPPPSPEEAGLDLPSAWQLCSLGQVTIVTDPNPSHRYPDYSGGTVPILSTREFSGDSGWNPATAKLTTETFWQFQRKICDFAEGDIVFARKGRLGLPRYLPNFDRFTFSHTLFVLKPMTGLDSAYLLCLLRRDEVVQWLTSEMNQNTGVPTLGKAKTERLPIALPPLAEQRRIVAKVDALMALCDKLEASLTAAADTRRRLLDALLTEALAPAEDRGLEAAA